MEVLDIDLKIPAISPPTIVMKMVFLMLKVLGCLRLMDDIYLGINITATIPIEIVDFIDVVLKLVKMEKVDICLKIKYNLPLAIVKQVLMLMGEVEICLIPATPPPTT